MNLTRLMICIVSKIIDVRRMTAMTDFPKDGKIFKALLIQKGLLF